MQVPSSSCISPPTHMAHDLLPVRLGIYWVRGVIATVCPLCGTHRDQPHRWGACLTPIMGNCRGTLCPTESLTQPHVFTHRAGGMGRAGTSTARVRSEPTAGALVSWQKHTSQCLPPPGSSLLPQVSGDQCGQVTLHVTGQAGSNLS